MRQLLGLPPWVDFSVELDAEPLVNAGGRGSSGAWIQQFSLGAAFSSGLAKEATQWNEADHWQLNTQLMLFSGRAGYGQAIGAAFPLQATDHPTGLWLTEASLERQRGLGPVSLKAGLLSLNPDFIDMPVFDLFVHSALDNTLNLTVLGLPINPLVAPGAVGTLDLGDGGHLRIGAYWLDSQTQLAELFGVDPLQPLVQGTTQLVQWSFSNLPGAKRVQTPIQLGQQRIERQLPPPLLQLGAIHSRTAQQGRNRVVYGALNLPLELPLGLDHRLWAGVNVGLDPSRNTAPLFLSGGWASQGLLPGRPHDVLALGLGRTSFGPAEPGQIYEGVIELNYSAAFSRSLSLGPVVQLILNPGGSGDVPSIVAAGLQFQLSL
jgi:porin